MTTGCWISTGHGIVRELRPGQSAALLCYMWLQLVELPHTKSLTKFATTTATRTATCYRPVSLFIECSLDFLACGFLFLQFCFWKIAAHSAHNKQRREQARPWLNCKPGSCRTWNKFEHCLHDQLTRCLRVPTVFRTHSALTLFISFILFSIHSLFRPFVAFGSENSKEVYRLQRRWVGFLLGGRRNMLDILGNNIVYYLVGRGTSNKTVYVLTKWAAKHVKISNWF